MVFLLQDVLAELGSFRPLDWIMGASSGLDVPTPTEPYFFPVDVLSDIVLSQDR